MEGIGGKHGWSWIFILEGLFTVLFGVCCFFIMPATPFQAKFLTTQEKQYIDSVLREDGVVAQSDEDDAFDWSQVRKAFASPHVILMAISAFFSGTTLYALAYFLPTIISILGFAGNRAQLMSVPPYAVSFVLPLQAWMANNSAPYVRRASALALFTTMTNSGGILSTWLLGSLSPAPQYTKASITLVIFQIGMLFCAFLNLVHLTRQNKQKLVALSHSKLGRDAEDHGLGDESIWFKYKL
ncbi:hypothetical protein EW026_g4007 [Hermanssonia centrifuga]|uniref:Uncharacterized protein n=1 Tax=Hermanssonia centrifuga TaxID=98765 RepID=A0A4S4KII6_9APHY|nr:hypothetical protein EW026_g4007 [Hermanssonia centrifuga]